MPNINHNVLTDPFLHEPRGCSTASLGQVYIANGSGSGTWTNHNAITDPFIHEPRGVSTAAVNQVYVSNGAGSGSWTNLARAVRATGAADQTITAGVLTILDFDTTEFNTGGYTVASTGRITVPTTGTHIITSGVTVEATVSALTSAILVITRNANVVSSSNFDHTLSSGSTSALNCSTIINLTAGDIVDCRLIATGVGVPVVRNIPTFVGLTATQVNHLAIQRLG